MSEIINNYPILLPSTGTDLTKWAAVACDQFTSEPKYWQELAQLVGDAPSTLRMILPEVYLGQNDADRIDGINAAMTSYLSKNAFRTVSGGMILTRRTTEYGHGRTGIVMSIDVEAYSFRPSDRAPIRATEGTVLERIPPRMKIRENAPLEVPHIMMLVDDETDSVLKSVKVGEQLYDFDLNMRGGHLSGWAISNFEEVRAAFDALLDPARQISKYGFDAGLLMAVGDGNHSLATAKACWEKLKPTLTIEEQRTHPARFALVEAVNIYDSGIIFEPIYRVAFGDVAELPKFLSSRSGSYPTKGCLVTAQGDAYYPQSDSCVEAVADIDEKLSAYAHTHRITVDYVHGVDSVREIVAKGSAVGVLLPTLAKSELFRTVACGGVLPRKTFSMGEAREKRYYFESKKINKQ